MLFFDDDNKRYNILTHARVNTAAAVIEAVIEAVGAGGVWRDLREPKRPLEAIG